MGEVTTSDDISLLIAVCGLVKIVTLNDLISRLTAIKPLAKSFFERFSELASGTCYGDKFHWLTVFIIGSYRNITRDEVSSVVIWDDDYVDRTLESGKVFE